MKHHRRVVLAALIVMLLALAVAVAGCAAPVRTKTAESYSYDMAPAMEPEAPAAAPQAARGMAYDGAGEVAQSTAMDAATAERMIIRTMNMSVVVEDTDETMSTIRDTLRQFNGFVANSNRWMVGNQPYASVTVRVPAESLDALVDTVRGMAIRVENEHSSGQDVTEEYVDIQARLRNLEATETELLALLTEVRENRSKAEDVLAIHREITNIRGQIESLKGRSQYLERMTALATLSIEIRPRQAPGPVVEAAQWNPLITLNRALRAFIAAFQVLLDLAIYIVIFSPFVLVPIGALLLLVRALRRRKGRPTVGSAAAS
jgi:hypothetical protein